jgi:hypothetical protein
MINRCECGAKIWGLQVKTVSDEMKFDLVSRMFNKYSLEEMQEIFEDK